MGNRTSYSALTTFRTCPQRWNYQYRQRLEVIQSEETRVELGFGHWWHALRAAESVDRGTALGTLRYIPETLGTVDGGPRIPVTGEENRERVYAEAERWWSTLSEVTREEWVERLGQDLSARLRYVDEEWEARWAAEREHEHPLAVELPWKRDLPSLPHGRDPQTEVVGFVDEVYLDTRRNIVVVRDHKTHRTLATQTFSEEMLDSQLQLYAWGISPTVTEWGVGVIRAVAYDRVRMVAPKEPKLTLTGSLSKSVTDYDARTYQEWVGEGIVWGKEGETYASGQRKGQRKWGTYTLEEGVLERLTDPASLSIWQQRSLTPLNINVVRTHLASATYSAVDIAEAVPRIEAVGEGSRNLARHCHWCDYATLCRAQMIGGARGEYDLEAMRLRIRPRRS